MNALLPATNDFVVVNGEVYVDYVKKKISVLDWCIFATHYCK
jgi:hypothetical protein